MNNHTNRATRLAIKMIEVEDEEQDMHELVFEFQVYMLALYARQVYAFKLIVLDSVQALPFHEQVLIVKKSDDRAI